MRKILLLMALASQLGFAQKLQVKSVEMIKATAQGGFYHPRFSPNGDYLLTSKVNYSGLKMYSFADSGLKTITEDPGAGYGTQISEDGNTIFYKKSELRKNLRYTSLVSYSKKTDIAKEIVAPTRKPLTVNLKGGALVYVKGNKMIKSKSIKNAQQKVMVICVEDRKMALYVDGEKTILTPNGEDASYIWPSVSPDQKHIVYTVVSKGTFVCDILGNDIASLGKLSAPVWLDNQWVVGMDDKDNGEKLISSTLVAATADGKVRQTIEAPEGKMAMYPAASADGKRIAFNTENGELFVIDLLTE